MKFVSWNIGRGYDPRGIIELLRSLNADLYALFELDRGVKRTKGVDMFVEIEKGLGMRGHYAIEFEEIESVWRTIIPWGGSGGGETGNAIFTHLPVLSSRTIKLPKRPPLLYEGSTWIPELFQPRRGSRTAQVVTLRAGNSVITCCALHAELWRSDWNHRRKQLEYAVSGISPKTLVLMGDFNNVGGAALARLRGHHDAAEVVAVRHWLASKGLSDSFSNDEVTCGRFSINAKIDWLASGKAFHFKEKKLIRTGLSDHSCLFVELETEPSS